LNILVVSDAWHPQINGVVRTLQRVGSELRLLGYRFDVIGPDRFRTVPCPSYPEIPLAVNATWTIGAMIDDAQPSAIHIATEGPLGLAARRHCLKRGYPFTTSYHTRFPEYVHARIRLPVSISYAWMRRFHSAAQRTMVATDSMRRELTARGFRNLAMWSRGVDTELFRPREKSFLSWPRPIWLYVGRVAIEKNIEAFLRLELPGTKLVVGDGPQLPELRRKFPDVRFAGAKTGEELAQHFAASDTFVFPSRTDTFGLVLLEALASGLPVAALPVPGPIDIVNGSPVGCLDDDLAKAAQTAINLDPKACRQHALLYSWDACAQQFLTNLSPFGPATP